MMSHELFETDLKTRMIDREGDLDFFIETDYYPVNLLMNQPLMSRLQFPLTRAIIVRTTPCSKWVTVHILQDTDLHSSIANFELDLTQHRLLINQKEGYVVLELEEAV